jgi:hypothetical protein
MIVCAHTHKENYLEAPKIDQKQAETGGNTLLEKKKQY